MFNEQNQSQEEQPFLRFVNALQSLVYKHNLAYKWQTDPMLPCLLVITAGISNDIYFADRTRIKRQVGSSDGQGVTIEFHNPSYPKLGEAIAKACLEQFSVECLEIAQVEAVDFRNIKSNILRISFTAKSLVENFLPKITEQHIALLRKNAVYCHFTGDADNSSVFNPDDFGVKLDRRSKRCLLM